MLSRKWTVLSLRRRVWMCLRMTRASLQLHSSTRFFLGRYNYLTSTSLSNWNLFIYSSIRSWVISISLHVVPVWIFSGRTVCREGSFAMMLLPVKPRSFLFFFLLLLFGCDMKVVWHSFCFFFLSVFGLKSIKLIIF